MDDVLRSSRNGTRHNRRPISRKFIGAGMWAILALAEILSTPRGVWAHHGLAEFDTTHTVRMEGTVTDFQWINPHAFIFATMKDENGKIANWKLELGGLYMLTKYGHWTPETVKRGDKITVQGFKAKDGSAYFSVGAVWLSNGQRLEGKP